MLRSSRLELKPRDSLAKEENDALLEILSRGSNTRYLFGGNGTNFESFVQEKFTFGQSLSVEEQISLTTGVLDGPGGLVEGEDVFKVVKLRRNLTGLGALVLVGSYEVVGFAGLLPLRLHVENLRQLPTTSTEMFEFGFVLDESKWGMGLATEIGEAQIEYAFKHLDVYELYGLSHPENVASIKVLKDKLGLKYLGAIEVEERGPRQVFSITREQHEKKKASKRMRLLSYAITDLDTDDVRMMTQWKNMHLEWLRRYGLWEQADQDALDAPFEHITQRGGKLMGIVDEHGTLLASIGARPANDVRWELVKLAVNPLCRNSGLAKKLLSHAMRYCIGRMKNARTNIDKEECYDNDQGTIYLDTSSKLVEAIGLYSKFGFQIITDSPQLGTIYYTADVYMERSFSLNDIDSDGKCFYDNSSGNDSNSSSSSNPKHLIICDIGEDFDDELALYWATLHPLTPSVTTYVVFVGGSARGTSLLGNALSEWRRDKWIRLSSRLELPENVLQLLTLDEFEQLLDSADNNPSFDATLVCAPLHLTDSLYLKLSRLRTRMCCLSGSLCPGALNFGSTKVAQEAIKQLLSTASESYIFPTSELQKSLYTPELLRALPSHLQDCIKANAYKFIVGRAGSARGDIPAKHVAHLLSPSIAQKIDGKSPVNYTAIDNFFKITMNRSLSSTPTSSVSPRALQVAKEYSTSLYGFTDYCKEIEVDESVVINEFAIAFHGLFEMKLCELCMYSEDDCFEDDYILNRETTSDGYKMLSNIISKHGSPFPCYDLTALKLMYKILQCR